MRLTRRFVLAGAAALAIPAIARGQARPSVVVVGGGAGGASAAKQLAKQSDGKLDITLVTAGQTFATCFFSNHVIAGLRPMGSIVQSYDRLASHGIRVAPQPATAIDRDRKRVRVGETVLTYDRLVLSPGIDMIFDAIDGYSEAAAEIAPHAWQAGKQTELLKAKLDALRDGDPVVVVAPPNPYRCPPGPYERASVIAHVLKAKGFARSRITILDPKEKYSKQALFEAGWARHFPGMIEWYGPSVIGAIKSVDAAAGKVVTDFDTFEGALLNVIPAQRAGAIAVQSGLADTSGYCPVDPSDFRSTIDPAIHVIGDAAIAGEMPKSAFSANSQARRAAATIVSELLGRPLAPTELANTCWSMLEAGDSVKIGARYAVTDGKLTAVDPFISALDESASTRRETFDDSLRWYDRAIADMFG
jgi:sulfide dehydrogenase [flavocytochrome c] flavoprotein subunit